MSELYDTDGVVPGTTCGSALGVFQRASTLALAAWLLLGCTARLISHDSVAQPLTLDTRWSVDTERARQGFSQINDAPR
jgi:hypothetical protein